MAGRGRGRGASMSFLPSQLGVAPGENLPLSMSQPPPAYPTPENRALPLDLGESGDYLLILKQNHAAFMRDAPTFLEQVVVKHDIQRYADRYQAVTAKSCTPAKTGLNEKYYPVELRKKKLVKKKRKLVENGTAVPAKTAKKVVDITGRLEELEKKEKAGDMEEDDDIVDRSDDVKDPDGEGDEAEGEEFDEEDMDDEMDEGTDYINSYFDNGEDYGDDEDDNLDDGPTY